MLYLVGGGRLNKVFFSDEKIFNVEPLCNLQNRRQLFKKSQQKSTAVTTIGCSHFLMSVKVWTGIGVDWDLCHRKMRRNFKINAASYWQQVLRDVLDLWIMQYFGPAGLMLQQDWARAHSANSPYELLGGSYGRTVRHGPKFPKVTTQMY